jgi:hypothetical protein
MQEELEVKEDNFPPSRIGQLRSLTPTQKVSLLSRITSQHHHARPLQIRKTGGISSPVVTAGERKVDSLRRQRKRRSNDKDKTGNTERPGNITVSQT